MKVKIIFRDNKEIAYPAVESAMVNGPLFTVVLVEDKAPEGSAIVRAVRSSVSYPVDTIKSIWEE